MKKIFSIFMLMLLMAGFSAKAADEIYAVWDASTTTLTLRYDDQKTANSGVTNWSVYKADATKVVLDISMQKARPTSTAYWFRDFKKLTAIQDLNNLITSEVDNMAGMFQGCSSLESITLGFSTTHVHDMSSMFSGCSSLKSIDFGFSFNTVNVTDMSRMFLNCSSLTTLDFQRFNTVNVQRMTSMFYGCSSLKWLDLGWFHLPYLFEMSNMFQNCIALEELDISYFDPRDNVIAANMFKDCSKLKTICCDNDWSIKVIDDRYMFEGCSSLTGEQGTKCDGINNIRSGYARPDEGESKPGYFTKGCLARIYTSYLSESKTLTYYYDCNFYARNEVEFYDPDVMRFTGYYSEVEKVVIDKSMQNAPLTTTEKMFYGGDAGGSNVGQLFKVETIEGLENLNTSDVTDMRLMFFGCNSLTSLDLRKFDMSNVTNTSNMFAYCGNLKTIRCNDDWSKLTNITDSENMFKGCTNLTGGYGTTLTDGVLNKSYARPDFNDEEYYGYFTADKQVYTVFDEDTTLTYYCDDKYLVRQGTVEIYNPSRSRFAEYNTLVKKAVINASMADTLLTSMKYMFYGNPHALTFLKEIEGMEYLNTSKTEIMAGMFKDCFDLESIDLSHFDTRFVSDMTSMFEGCTKIKELDLTSFQFVLGILDDHFVGRLKYMSSMFFNCRNLETIYCNSNWSLYAKVTGIDDTKWMFMSCENLKGDEGTVYDESNPHDITYAHPDGGTDTPGYFTQKRKLYTSFEGGVLTYYYDGLSESKSGTQEDYTPEAGHDKKRFAAYHDQIKKVVIDESLQRFQPTTLANMFDGGSGNELSALDTIEGLEYIDFSEVTDMYAMFAGCSSLKDINLSTFNTDKVTNMAFLFYDCSTLKNPDMTGFSTANVTDMRRVFYGCSAITELDLNNFKTDKVTTVFKMFEGCSALTTIYSDNDWSSIADGGDMFKGCTALVGGNGTTCDGTTNINSAYAHLDEAGNPGYFSKKTTTALDQITNDQSPITNKVLIDGQLYILREGKMYSVQGQEVR